MAAEDEAAHRGQAKHQNDSDAAELAQAAGAPSQGGSGQEPQAGDAPAAPRGAAAESPTEIAGAVPSAQEGSGELHMHTEAAESETELLAAKQLKQEPAEGACPPAGAPQGAPSEVDIRHTTHTQQRLPAACVHGHAEAAIGLEVSVKELAEAPSPARDTGGDMAAEASDAAAGASDAAAGAGNTAAEAAEACDQPAECTAEAKQASADHPSAGDEGGMVLTQDGAAAAAAEHRGPAEKEAVVEGTAEDDHVRVIPSAPENCVFARQSD